MKRVPILITLLVLFLFSNDSTAENRDQLVQYLPRNSFLIAGADFSLLKENSVYESMERNGQIWSYDDSDGIIQYIQALQLDTKRDIDSFALSKYVTNYGSGGKVHLFLMKRDWSDDLTGFSSTQYLDSSLYRLSQNQDMYAVLLTPLILAVGNLNETKMAVDVAGGKVAAMRENATLASLYDKIPTGSAVWGVSLPLSRRQAADVKAKQSTNAIISGFQSYYFFGIPTKAATRTQFYGQTEDTKQASFISSFMIGTLLVTKIRAEQPLAEMLDQIDIQNQGNSVHVTMVITKEMVDAYYAGKLGF